MCNSIQIQAILYNNKKEFLERSLESIANAAAVNQRSNRNISRVIVSYGDASPSAIFSDQELCSLQTQYKDYITLNYRFFNKNTGSALGHNLLAENCDTHYLTILNPDVLLPPSFFSTMLEPFKDNSLDVGLVEARQIPLEHPKIFDIETGETSWASTACAVTPTSLFKQLGGFDADSFFLYGDDVDYSWQVREAGKHIVYQSCTPVYHPKQPTIQGTWPGSEAEKQYSAEATLMLAYKWSSKQWKTILSDFKKSSDINERHAAQIFSSRLKNNSLPEQHDKQHAIALFHEGTYEKLRFTVS